ncbi:hypothetical protein AS006_05935 [Thermotoga sp. SG1]|nr:hypothetical protein AS006_05935 [Thermotoga sp. SG1]
MLKGNIKDFDATKWHHIKISFKYSEIKVFLDNTNLCYYNDEVGGISSGLVVLGSGYHKAIFDEVLVEPVETIFLYTSEKLTTKIHPLSMLASEATFQPLILIINAPLAKQMVMGLLLLNIPSKVQV